MQSIDSLWPSEFRSEISPLLQEFHKGTLSETTMPTEPQDVMPLPPIIEKVFDDIEEDKIKMAIHTSYCNTNYRIMRLHKSTNSMVINGNIKLA